MVKNLSNSKLKFSLIVLILGFFFSNIVSCTKPKIELKQINENLSLNSTGLSISNDPFARSTTTYGYLKFSGTCPKKGVGLQWSKDQTTWYSIPQNTQPSPSTSPSWTPGLEYNLESAGTYNGNCTNGVFNVWLFESQLVNASIITVNDSLSTMYLAAVDSSGSRIAELQITDSSSIGGTRLVLDKPSPRGIMPDSGCFPIFIYLKNESGMTVSAASNISFDVNYSGGGPITYYTDNACTSPSVGSPATGLSINSGNYYATIYFKSQSLAVGNPITFVTSNSSGLTNIPLAMQVESYSGSKVLVADLPDKMYDGECYLVNLAIKDFSGATAGPASVTYNLSLSGLSAYTLSTNCTGQTSAVSSINFVSVPTASLYLRKNNSVTSSTVSFVTSPTTSTYFSDPAQEIINDTFFSSSPIDLKYPAGVEVRLGSKTFSLNTCYEIKLGVYNRAHTQVPATASGVSFTFADSPPGGITTLNKFANSTDCSVGSPPLTTPSLAQYEYQKTIYIKFTGSLSSGSHQGSVTISSSGLRSYILPYVISVP